MVWTATAARIDLVEPQSFTPNTQVNIELEGLLPPRERTNLVLARTGDGHRIVIENFTTDGDTGRAVYTFSSSDIGEYEVRLESKENQEIYEPYANWVSVN